MTDFKNGDRIIMSYWHHTNATTSFLRYKHGIFLYTPQRYKKIVGKKTLIIDKNSAMVLWDGNKNPTKVERKLIHRELE